MRIAQQCAYPAFLVREQEHLRSIRIDRKNLAGHAFRSDHSHVAPQAIARSSIDQYHVTRGIRRGPDDARRQHLYLRVRIAKS